MAYNYYCTYCGRELSQETVLFDMKPILTGSTDDPFQVVCFRMTKDELEALIASGTPSDQGYVHCELSLQDIMKYVSNEHNLNDPAIAALTMGDIQSFCVSQLDQVSDEEEEDEQPKYFVLSEEEKAEPEENTKEKAQKPAYSEAIRALENTFKANKDAYFLTGVLKKELRVLNQIFRGSEKYGFEIKRNTERDNNGRELLIGYTVDAGIPKRKAEVKNRQCWNCHNEVFEHAGTAVHRAVSFIGDQETGKTCTILALAHYAKNAIQGAMGSDEIWKDSQPIPAVDTIKLVSPSPELQSDLEDYGLGIAPEKTLSRSRKDAYSATFWIKNKDEEKHYLLTLTDLPGELCNGGTIDTAKILNEFQIALACDTFILCFDASKAMGGEAVNMVDKVCDWADQFQILRESNQKNGSGAGLYAPVMVIFNKSSDLENANERGEVPKGASGFDTIASTYIFDRERRSIEANQANEQNQVYKRLGEKFDKYASLKDAYQARLRCSPYGFGAPRAELVEKVRDPGQQNTSYAVDRETGTKLRLPQPKNIDFLMRWILEVSGCVPSQAQYQAGMGADSPIYRPEKNFATKTQYRTRCPSGNGIDGDVKEALLRCYLFENPGRIDKEYLRYFDQWAQLATARIKSKFMKN